MFNKIIQKQKEHTLDAGVKYAPHSDRLWVGSAKILISPSWRKLSK
ncbi:hypothetical protein SFCCH060_0758 [Shigella flexneri CCH060]|uniref:Uncharacterized protein n=1 Tax=Shigella flexneri CCH060 TaxID=754091 RepID=A0A6N3R1L7_SHIFL|nr:hypothetical protein SFCCH060_0758 [Shigella flexneri CCH060]EIQ60802.1 hypothetical protein SD22575_1865 [Shigella dysenteriae 225-75]